MMINPQLKWRSPFASRKTISYEVQTIGKFSVGRPDLSRLVFNVFRRVFLSPGVPWKRRTGMDGHHFLNSLIQFERVLRGATTR